MDGWKNGGYARGRTAYDESPRSPPMNKSRPTSTSKTDLAVSNFVKAVRSVARRETRFQHGPATLEFSWTSACNLRCVMCGQSDNPPVSKVSKEVAAPFLDKAFESVLIWNPSATSEPLLNDIDDLVAICSEKRVFLELYTNATRLTPAIYERIQPFIHRLTISIDSHVPAVLESVRWPLKAAKVFPNIEYAITRSNELAIPCIINAVMMKETVPHFADFIDWIADRGGREITVLDLLDGSSQAKGHDALAALGKDVVEGHLQAMKVRAAARGVNITFLLHPPFTGRFVHTDTPTRFHEALVVERFQEAHAGESAGFCPMVSHYLKVMPNGDAFPCCRGPEELKLGNVYEEGLDAVWNGAKAQALRSAMYKNQPPAPCVNCMVRKKALIEQEAAVEISGEWSPTPNAATHFASMPIDNILPE